MGIFYFLGARIACLLFKSMFRINVKRRYYRKRESFPIDMTLLHIERVRERVCVCVNVLGIISFVRLMRPANDKFISSQLIALTFWSFCYCFSLSIFRFVHAKHGVSCLWNYKIYLIKIQNDFDARNCWHKFSIHACDSQHDAAAVTLTCFFF